MDNTKLLQELENLAERLNITVRYEDGYFNGGLCRIKEDQCIIVNKKFPPEKKISILSRELSKIDLSGIHILPRLREQIMKELSV